MSETNRGTPSQPQRRPNPAPAGATRPQARRTAAQLQRRQADAGSRASAGKKTGPGVLSRQIPRVKALIGKATAFIRKPRDGRHNGTSKAPQNKSPKTNLLKSTFYRVYFALLAVALIVIACGLVWLKNMLADYESAQPIHVAEETMALFENQDFDALYALDSSAERIAGDDQGFYVQTMRDIVQGKTCTWNEAFSNQADERRYTVKYDGDTFATLKLVPSGETTARGNALWKVGSIETNVVTETHLDETLGERTRYLVTAPSDGTVTVDGTALTQDDAVKTDITAYPEDFLPPDVKQVSYTQYAFYTREDAPSVTVTAADGKALALVEDGENAWKCTVEQTGKPSKSLTKRVQAFAKKFAKFTAADVSEGSMKNETVEDSPAYEMVRSFDNRWAPTHKYAEFKNMKATDFVLQSKNCYTCRVTFDFILRTRRGTEQKYPTAYTFCIVREGKKQKIYNIIMN